MLILYSIDTVFERRPIINWLIFALLVMVFAIQELTWREAEEHARKALRYQMISQGAEVDTPEFEKAVVKQAEDNWPMQRFVLNGWTFSRIAGYNWLHLSVFLLVFNLIFLWPMGNAVCAQIGNWQYLATFLIVSFFAGIIHLLVSSAPASGVGAALACVAGMYIVFFPEIPMNCLFFFPRPVTAGLSTYFVVPLWFAIDLILAIAGLKGVTYIAHLLGFLAGVSIAVVALKNKWVELGKGERSLLEVLEKRKIEVTEATKEASQTSAEEKKEEFLERPAESAIMEALAGAKKIEPEKTAGQEEFVRFYCVCGQRIKVPKSYTGRAGRCPKCKSLVRIP